MRSPSSSGPPSGPSGGGSTEPGEPTGAPRDGREERALRSPRMPDSRPPGAGSVVEINIAPRHEELPAPVRRVKAVAGRGLEGDRNFLADGRPQPDRDADITLIAEEGLAGLATDTGIALSAAESRRNLLTRGVDVNELVGRRFAVGEVECAGIELCEPCRHLEGLT